MQHSTSKPKFFNKIERAVRVAVFEALEIFKLSLVLKKADASFFKQEFFPLMYEMTAL